MAATNDNVQKSYNGLLSQFQAIAKRYCTSGLSIPGLSQTTLTSDQLKSNTKRAIEEMQSFNCDINYSNKIATTAISDHASSVYNSLTGPKTNMSAGRSRIRIRRYKKRRSTRKQRKK